MTDTVQFNESWTGYYIHKTITKFNILAGLSKWLSGSRINVWSAHSKVLKDEKFNFQKGIQIFA